MDAGEKTAIITQFGSTLGFLAAQRAAEASGGSRSSLAGSQARTEEPAAREDAARPNCP